MSQREIRTIGIVAKPHKAEARQVLGQPIPWLQARGWSIHMHHVGLCVVPGRPK